MSELREAIARAIEPDWFGEVDGVHILDNYPGQHIRYQQRAYERADAALAAIEARGMVVVPKEPTRAMHEPGLAEMRKFLTSPECVYRAMIAAARTED